MLVARQAHFKIRLYCVSYPLLLRINKVSGEGCCYEQVQSKLLVFLGSCLHVVATISVSHCFQELFHPESSHGRGFLQWQLENVETLLIINYWEPQRMMYFLALHPRGFVHGWVHIFGEEEDSLCAPPPLAERLCGKKLE